jgi:hypothetical protein
MKKFSLTLLAATAMAVAGLAQADGASYPAGKVVELSDSDSLTLSSSSSTDTSVLGGPSSEILASDDSPIDTTVLGAGPTTRTTTVTTTQYVYVQPSIDFDRATAMTQMRSNAHLMRHGRMMDRSAAATFNTPTRAGEASTMTGGAPNVVTDNDRMIVGSYVIPHTAVTGPYYIFSH